MTHTEVVPYSQKVIRQGRVLKQVMPAKLDVDIAYLHPDTKSRYLQLDQMNYKSLFEDKLKHGKQTRVMKTLTMYRDGTVYVGTWSEDGLKKQHKDGYGYMVGLFHQLSSPLK